MSIKKLLVCGSRDFNDREILTTRLDEYLSSANLANIEIVAGGARGADTLAEDYAAERGIKFTKFPADWARYGKSAGFIRNAEMAEYCKGPMNTCIAFYDGQSHGTANMLTTALRKRMSIVKVLYKQQ